MKKFTLTFDGYWPSTSAQCAPNEAGIYCIYAASGPETEATPLLDRLLYIGECDSARDRLLAHDRQDDLTAQLKLGEHLRYSFAPLVFGRREAAAALIFAHKPPANPRFKHTFPFEPTSVHLRGKTHMLKPTLRAPEYSQESIWDSGTHLESA